MELEWDSRPVSVVHRHQEWSESPQEPGPSTSAYYSRRRSTTAPVPSPGPPPSQPIPNLPFGSSKQSSSEDLDESFSTRLPTSNDSYDAYSRPAASASLAAVAAFSQSHSTPPILSFAHPNPSPLPSSPPYNLSNSPPRSLLRPSMEPQHQDIMPHRLLLSPSELPSTDERRPSSRRALTRALELAREAVRIDSTHNDPHAAVAAYGRSVSLLSGVMERVMRGEDTTESHKRRNGRHRSAVAQEEEVRRLKSILDTYAERMNILSLIYSIPVDLQSHSSPFPTSTAATQPPSPGSDSPSETSDHAIQSASSTEDLVGDVRSSTTRPMNSSCFYDQEDGVEAIGSAMFNLDVSGGSGDYSSSSVVAPPYTISSAKNISTSTTPVDTYLQGSVTEASFNRVRTSTVPQPRVSHQGSIPTRTRASSTIPPPAPPPTSSLPPAPANVESPLELPSSRPRGSSVSHKRTGSGVRLRPLREENERSEDNARYFAESDDELRRLRSKSVLNSQREYNESTPLPPLPPQTSRSAFSTTSRYTNVEEQAVLPSQDLQNFISARPRGDSTLSTSSEAKMSFNVSAPVINASPINGTISLRRGKTSAPPSIQGSPDLESSSLSSTASISTMNRLTGSNLPANTASSLGMGRTRASSQPGRRPSIAANTNPYPSQSPAPGSRKVSVPSKLNPNAPPQILINTAQLTPPTATGAYMLVPPPPIPSDNIPSAPLSPLPSAPPLEPLRKPYHMMNLLRHTMTSKTGGYVTPRLHVPFEVWSQGGAKLANVPEKIRVVEVLLSALEELQNCSVDIFGAGNVSSGMLLGIGSIGRRDGEVWGSKLEEFSAICDGLVSNVGKKLAVGEGFVTKKTGGINAWGTKLTRQFDKLTTGKNLDSPTIYVQGLARLFLQTQLLDEHTKALTSVPIAPAYAAFPIEIRTSLEAKFRHSSEFFAKVVLTFVVRDLSQLLDKYVKKCEKWLAE